MTMDINNKKVEVQVVKNEDQTAVSPAKVAKRPFDVAFLMLPDEKLKQKQAKLGKLLNYGRQISLEDGYNNNDKADDSDEEIEVCGVETEKSEEESVKLQQNGGKYFHHQTLVAHQKPQVFDDPKPKLPFSESSSNQKSAFTKVNLPKDSRVSPNLSISPDLTYQNSLSPSPPILPRNYSSFPTNMLSPNQIFKNQTSNTYQTSNFPPETFTTPMENPFLMKASAAPEMLQPNFPKMRPVLTQYRPEIPYNYQQFQPQDVLKMTQPELKFAPEIRNPAAAILTSLLPPSLAALSLPAQNVCAKCNISFRMTSDLVYHMRSHHKNDSVDLSKKRREDKLKCPVCAESFRERHHLTRHMTAHQDKEEDSK